MFLDTLTQNLHSSIVRYPEVLSYLKSREVTGQDIKKYGIGFSKVVSVPQEDSQDKKNFDEECYRGRLLENKVIFPFRGLFGQVIGFVGRSIDTKVFKVFVIEQAKFEGFFFGLFEALPYIYAENRVYLVEGAFDLLAVSKVLPNSVATMTSKMSDAQYDILSLFCNNIVTIFDSDKAGDLGREKAVEKDKRIQSIHIGFKDPAKLLEDFKLKKFKEYMMKKVKDIEWQKLQ